MKRRLPLLPVTMPDIAPRLATWLLLLSLPLVAEGQAGGGGPSREGSSPRWFGSIGTGVQWSDYIVDDRSASTWDFDAGFALRGTLEREVAPRMSLGVAFNYARLPLTYATLGVNTGCARCAADATVSSYGGLFRYGGGTGFHQVVEVFLGAVRYGNFEQHAPRNTLPPSSNVDFAFGAGYGFGYAVASDWQVLLVQDALNSFHERSTAAQGGGRVARHYTTRLGLRVGF